MAAADMLHYLPQLIAMNICQFVKQDEEWP